MGLNNYLGYFFCLVFFFGGGIWFPAYFLEISTEKWRESSGLSCRKLIIAWTSPLWMANQLHCKAYLNTHHDEMLLKSNEHCSSLEQTMGLKKHLDWLKKPTKEFRNMILFQNPSRKTHTLTHTFPRHTSNKPIPGLPRSPLLGVKISQPPASQRTKDRNFNSPSEPQAWHVGSFFSKVFCGGFRVVRGVLHRGQHKLFFWNHLFWEQHRFCLLTYDIIWVETKWPN